MEGNELIAFKIISAVGSARSMYIEAIQLAKEAKFNEAEAMVEEGEQLFIEGHHAHAELIQSEANGEAPTINLLLIHAEDQLMSTEAFKILANEFIEVYKNMKQL